MLKNPMTSSKMGAKVEDSLLSDDAQQSAMKGLKSGKIKLINGGVMGRNIPQFDRYTRNHVIVYSKAPHVRYSKAKAKE